ncbi:RNA polymerase sigma factor [Cellulomonas marina]|uniref:RNA polymerase sigma factor n=1 Tax=Cellulomonas marina TaxID=988821 RepID=UPI001A4B2D0F|nr:sigma-70 family RNA polymerase sigma factor [Cellulomonas marina]GIG27811.1 DNA-directed RNA polymerase sigma-70 factor [Cellulomonas marina]
MDDRTRAHGASVVAPAAEAPVWEVAAEAFTAWRDGDAAAVGTLVRALTPTLWHVVRAYRLDEETARDVLQVVWGRLVTHAATVQDPRAVTAWLMTTARREAWRAAGRETRAHAAPDELLERAAPPVPGADELVGTRVRDRVLWQAVAALPERCRRLLRVVAFDERPDYRRIAEDLGMPVGSIGPTRGRCLVRLRALLAGTEAGPPAEGDALPGTGAGT